MSEAATVSQFPALDRDAARTFLEMLDPDANEFTFQTFTNSESRRRSFKTKADPLAKVLHGTLDQHYPTLVDLSRNGAGVFVTINKTTLRGSRNRDSVGDVRAYFIDCDGVTPEGIKAALSALGLEPHLVVETSAGKWHFYWCVENAPLGGFANTQKKLIALFDSDPSVCDLPRVMRVPGFPHQKDGSEGELVRLVQSYDGANYSEDEFQRALVAAQQLRGARAPCVGSPSPTSSPTYLQSQTTPDLADRLLHSLGPSSPDWSQGYPDGQRTHELERRAGSCLGKGMSEIETLWKCLQWNGRNQPPLDGEKVARTVAGVAKTHIRNHGPTAGFLTQISQSIPAALEPVSGDKLLSTAAVPRRYLAERFIPQPETTMLGGDGGTGKSTLALQLSTACITGSDWLGLKVTGCNVLYISAEDPADEIHFRLEQITKSHKIPEVELARFKLIDLAGKDATIAVFERGLIRKTPLLTEIERLAREHKAGCIILDSVADFFGGNENERREVRAFVGLLRGLAMELDAAVIFLAHPSVDGIKTGRGYSGSTHWNNAVRSRLYFTYGAKLKDDDGGPPLDPDTRTIELAKSNRARRGEQIQVLWLDGRFVVTQPGIGGNGKNDSEADELFLDLLSKASGQGVRLSPHRSPSFAPSYLAKMPGGRGIGRAALERAMHRLIEQGQIRVETSGPPSKQRSRLIVA